MQRKLLEETQLGQQPEPISQLNEDAKNLSAAPQSIIQKKENKTGMPDALKTGMENLSGYSMDDVKVHYNSGKPAQLNAHAYAQGSDIHIAPGQEKHLPHEAWHVVQQKQGRVKPTLQLKGKVNINDDAGLEKEADMMGAKALHTPQQHVQPTSLHASNNSSELIQCFGSIRWTNLDDQTPKYQQKGQEILSILTATPMIQNYLRNKNAIITLNFDGGNLASVIEHDDQVDIKLSPWFFEQESRGRIIGMLGHEFGVHPLADDAIGAGALAAENATFSAAGPGSIGTGVGTDSLSVDEGNQQDHLFAAVQGFPRFNAYRDTIIDLVTQMLAQQTTTHISDAHITDVIMSYLADVSTILATNDHRAKVITSPIKSAQYFAYVRTNWLTWLAGNDPTGRITALTPPPQGAWDVVKEVGKLIGKFGLSIGTDSTSNRKHSQSTLPTGALADATTIQTEVIGDYGWAIQPVTIGAPTPGLVEALEQSTGLPANTLIPAIQAALPAAGVRTQEQIDLDNRLTHMAAGNNKGILPDTIINTLATEFNHIIRVLKPNGKIHTFGTGARLLSVLVQVPLPQPHYRVAQ